MPRFVAEPLPEGCPWSGWTPPNVDWCELEHCAWVVNPADTVSNLAYVLFGVAMLVSARGLEPAAAGRVSIFGPASILVGLLSGIYHASYTYFFQFFDFVGMFVFCFAVLTANAIRLGWIDPARRWLFFGVGVAVSSALVPVISESPIPIQTMVGLLIAAILAQELVVLRRRDPATPRTDYRLFIVALALLGGAATASLLDVSRTWCDPTSWIQGHAIWHLLSAASLFALFHFYIRLPAEAVR